MCTHPRSADRRRRRHRVADPSLAWRCRLGGTALVLVLSACGGSTADQPPEPDGTARGEDAARVEGAAEALDRSATPTAATEAFTGGRTKVVWLQDLGDGTDVFGLGDQLVLMGFDTGDDQGERMILETPDSYAKPLITPSGDSVVYSDRRNDAVMVVDWSGANRRRLAGGFPLAVWRNPDDATEWVYVGSDPDEEDPPRYRRIHRHPIDRPDDVELVWDRQPVSGDGFQVSRDGRLAAALAQWPDAGVIELPSGAWRHLGDGCWTALAGDDSHLLWIFDGQHRNLTIVDTDADEDRRWNVNINDAPGIDGFEVLTCLPFFGPADA